MKTFQCSLDIHRLWSVRIVIETTCQVGTLSLSEVPTKSSFETSSQVFFWSWQFSKKKSHPRIPGFLLEDRKWRFHEFGVGSVFQPTCEVEDNWSKVENMGNTEVGISLLHSWKPQVIAGDRGPYWMQKFWGFFWEICPLKCPMHKHWNQSCVVELWRGFRLYKG